MLSNYAPKSGWTPELKQEVCDLWGTKTATEIAAELNGRGYTFSRNAIIGLLHRSGKSIEHKTAVHPQTPDNGPRRPRVKTAAQPIEGRIQLGIGPQVQAINRARAEAAKPKPAPEPFICAEATHIVPLKLSLHELQDGDCRWPDGDAPYTFCGHPAIEGKPYCLGHCRLAFNGIPNPKRAGFIGLGKSSGGVFGRVA